MSKIKQREVMKTFAIAQLVIKQTANVVNIPPVFIDYCVSMNEFALAAIISTPAKVFRADKPKVDERRLRRSRRQVKNVKSLTLTSLPSDSDVVMLGIDPAKNGCDRTAITRVVSTPSNVNSNFFTEQYMQKPDVDNSEESYLKYLHEKAGIETYKWTNK